MNPVPSITLAVFLFASGAVIAAPQTVEVDGAPESVRITPDLLFRPPPALITEVPPCQVPGACLTEEMVQQINAGLLETDRIINAYRESRR
jgi:hypothetical protein